MLSFKEMLQLMLLSLTKSAKMTPIKNALTMQLHANLTIISSAEASSPLMYTLSYMEARASSKAASYSCLICINTERYVVKEWINASKT